jgi:hypothetical protein
VGFVNGKPGSTFLSFPVWPIEALANWDFDAILIADMADIKELQARLIENGVPRKKMVALCSLT